MDGYKIISEFISQPIIQLKSFDINLYNKVITKKDNQLAHIDNQSKIKYNVYYNNELCGFVGLIPGNKDVGFTQIIIIKQFRGYGLLKLIYQALVNKHRLKRLYARIMKSNVRSVKAHLKIGFKEISEEETKAQIKMGRMSRYQTTLYKDY